MILGDFNAHSELWGSYKHDTRRHIIETLLDEEELVVLNTGQATRFNINSNSNSAIYLYVHS